MIPQEIRDRYEAGERTIRVSSRIFAAYCDGLVTNYRRSPYVRRVGDVSSVAYKAARVVLDLGGAESAAVQ